jgi:hypothetical protein
VRKGMLNYFQYNSLYAISAANPPAIQQPALPSTP